MNTGVNKTFYILLVFILALITLPSVPHCFRHDSFHLDGTMADPGIQQGGGGGGGANMKINEGKGWIVAVSN